MKKILFALVAGLFLQTPVLKAQLAPGECGIMFTYDATGSQTKREYICNNTGAIMNRQGMTAETSYLKEDEKKSSVTEEIIKVNAIAPNPTSGIFTVTLAKALQNARVSLLNSNGSLIEHKRITGNTISFNISNQPAGMYYVKIYQGNDIYTFRIVKQ